MRDSLAAVRLLPTAQCALRTAYRLLPTAHCLLPTAYCLLPTAHCALRTAYRTVNRQPVPYLSPAAGNTGVRSTGMSFILAMTESISGVDTPYFASKR